MRNAFRPTLFACLGLAIASAGAESTATSDIFLNAYIERTNGEKLEGTGDTAGALNSYKQSIALLDQIAREDPAWKPDVVKHSRETAAAAVARLEPSGAKPNNPSQKQVDQEKLVGPLPSNEAIIPGTEDFNPKKPGPKKTPPALTNPVNGDKVLQSAAAYVKKVEDDLANTKAKLDQAMQEKDDLIKKYEDARKKAADMVDRDLKLQKRAELAEAALMKAEKDDGAESAAAKSARDEIASLRRQLRDVRDERDADREIEEQLTQSLRNARQRITTAYGERDAARKDNKDFPGKIAEMQKEIDKALSEKSGVETKLAKATESLNKVTTERDEAVTQLAKMKEASKNVDKLMSENTTLMAKLTAAETQIKEFKAQGEEKDKQIAAMKVEMGSVKQQLETAKAESKKYQEQMASLQTKLDAQAADLAKLKSDAKLNETERKRLAEENETLRGIVVRQMKQQAVREKTKQLVLTELAKLDVSSKALLDQIEFLGQPVVKLTEKEKKLFKQPQIEISDTEINIAAPKEAIASNTTSPAEVANDAKPATDSTPPPDSSPASDAANSTEKKTAKTDANPAKPPVEGDLPANDAKPKVADATPSGEKPTTPSTNIPNGTQGTGPTKSPNTGATSGTTADNMAAPDSGSPAVPAELLSQAKEAKEQFDKGNYRDAEKIYERLLQKAPNNLYILSNLGVVRFRGQKLKLAEESFKKAIAIAPEDAFSRCTLGIVYYSEQKFDDAVNELTKALAINPKNATAHNYLGITASQKGWQEAAQKELETATALDPQYPDAWFNLAVVYATMQPPNKELARKCYKRAVELGAEPDPALEQLIK